MFLMITPFNIAKPIFKSTYLPGCDSTTANNDDRKQRTGKN